MTPEAKIKAKIKRVLVNLSTKSGLPLFVDTPPASQYGAGGRPDHMVMLGNLLFFIEAKAVKRKPTPRQAEWHERVWNDHRFRTLVICGDDGVKQLPNYVAKMMVDHMKDVQADTYWTNARHLYHVCRQEQERMNKQVKKKSYDI